MTPVSPRVSASTASTASCPTRPRSSASVAGAGSIHDGQRIRLKGRGEPGRNNGPAGDLFVKLGQLTGDRCVAFHFSPALFEEISASAAGSSR